MTYIVVVSGHYYYESKRRSKKVKLFVPVRGEWGPEAHEISSLRDAIPMDALRYLTAEAAQRACETTFKNELHNVVTKSADWFPIRKSRIIHPGCEEEYEALGFCCKKNFDARHKQADPLWVYCPFCGKKT